MFITLTLLIFDLAYLLIAIIKDDFLLYLICIIFGIILSLLSKKIMFIGVNLFECSYICIDNDKNNQHPKFNNDYEGKKI